MKELKTNDPNQCTGGVTTIIIDEGGKGFARKVSKAKTYPDIELKAGVNYVGQDENELCSYTVIPPVGKRPADGKFTVLVKGDGQPENLVFTFIDPTSTVDVNPIDDAQKAAKQAKKSLDERQSEFLSSLGF